MSHLFPLDKLGLTPQQLAACKRADVSTAAELLLVTPNDLSKKFRATTTLQGVQELVRAVAKAVTPHAPSLDELLLGSNDNEDEDENERSPAERKGAHGWLSTGDVEMDRALGGGLRLGNLTEIAGESASGKSHLCMSLALAAQIPSLARQPGGTLILTSEREIATTRLVELAKPLLARHDPTHSISVKSLLDRVITNRVKDADALETLLIALPSLLQKHNSYHPSPLITGRPASQDLHHSSSNIWPIRLLVLDSITALLRGDAALPNTSRGLTDRSRFLCNVTDRLKTLALEYNLAIVVINQVSDVFSRPPPAPTPSSIPTTSSSSLSQRYIQGPEPPMLYSTQSRWFSGQSTGYHKEASLGIVWANAVNTRIMLSRTTRRRTLNPDDLTPISRKRRRDEDEEEDGQGFGVLHDEIKPTLIRRMHVVFSPHAPSSVLDYIITPTGVHALQDSYKRIDLTDALKRRDANAKYAAKHALLENSQVLQRPDDEEVLEEEEEDEFGEIPEGFWEYEKEEDLAEPLALGADM
ncbi:P-loop containing nucleoside triphosphate hydrolase protein [Naematelia encephala]|uniref:p-loop containing nucleoside triphosphate hydrolase protein n=1 Tax=Naematelia encephala TaxID=71784 RepID=A0A1Y2ARR1_9TREE|nr:P-loop containing nucleoside triphosphate hydrolase protein [Naematelia encephala]